MIRKLFHPEILAGYSFMMTLLLCIGGIIMPMLGLISEYVGRVYISISSKEPWLTGAALVVAGVLLFSTAGQEAGTFLHQSPKSC